VAHHRSSFQEKESAEGQERNAYENFTNQASERKYAQHHKPTPNITLAKSVLAAAENATRADSPVTVGAIILNALVCDVMTKSRKTAAPKTIKEIEPAPVWRHA
jgi:hypothetical protein